jgi:hypothetical protein
MHAVIVSVTINDPEAATSQLREEVVPAVKQIPGLVAGYWARKNGSGTSMVVFESEDAAKAASERVPTMVSDAVTIEKIEVGEVVAHT